MKQESLEQRLRDHFQMETRGTTPPREWWDRKISRLDEEKKTSRWHGMIPRTRLAWVLLPVILLFIGGTAYAAGSYIRDTFFGPSANHTKPGVYYVPTGIIYFQELPDVIVEYGKSVGMNITFTNFDSQTRITPNFPPRITIESRNLPFDARTIRSFEPGQEQVQLEPGESREYVFAWDQKDGAGRQVPYGWYEIRAMVQSQSVTDTKHNRGSGGRITRVLVLPPEGTMEKTFEVNEHQTVNGVAIYLEKMELQTQGAKITTFITSSDYNPENFSMSYSETEGDYRVDNENWKPAIKAQFGTIGREDGVRHIWDLDPVPLDARELTLRINRINGWEGPWEFKVPLQ